MGKSPSEIRQMSSTDIDLLAMYWKAEPWGPLRDNMHAGLIAREIRRPWLKDPSKNAIDDFILKPMDQHQEENQQKVAGFFSFFKTIANRVKKSERKPAKRRKRVKENANG
jgi:hypothetical protein